MQADIETRIELNNVAILTSLQNNLNSTQNQLQFLHSTFEQKLESFRGFISDTLYRIQQDNETKLEQMRATVEEKLHGALESRLQTSFKLVSDRLEMVHRGLGEMQSLATGVSDIKKIFSNVKTRGIWGEVQLQAILEDLLTKDQYLQNALTNPNTQNRVEFAIKLPGKSDGNSVLLPVDAKFPLSDYQKIITAVESGDEPDISQLDSVIKKSAKMISDKYLNPPYTTDFALMFLPIESLYAEVWRRPGLMELIQREYRVIITGPTTFSAILNSLQMGFRAIVIEQRSTEVWKIMEAVRIEFIRLTDLLGKTRVKLEQAGKVIGDAEKRSRLMETRLKAVASARVAIPEAPPIQPDPEDEES